MEWEAVAGLFLGGIRETGVKTSVPAFALLQSFKTTKRAEPGVITTISTCGPRQVAGLASTTLQKGPQLVGPPHIVEIGELP
jgi:hypothetical protein